MKNQKEEENSVTFTILWNLQLENKVNKNKGIKLVNTILKTNTIS